MVTIETPFKEGCNGIAKTRDQKLECLLLVNELLETLPTFGLLLLKIRNLQMSVAVLSAAVTPASLESH